jgi:hypothetical protein
MLVAPMLTNEERVMLTLDNVSEKVLVMTL